MKHILVPSLARVRSSLSVCLASSRIHNQPNSLHFAIFSLNHLLAPKGSFRGLPILGSVLLVTVLFMCVVSVHKGSNNRQLWGWTGELVVEDDVEKRYLPNQSCWRWCVKETSFQSKFRLVEDDVEKRRLPIRVARDLQDLLFCPASARLGGRLNQDRPQVGGDPHHLQSSLWFSSWCRTSILERNCSRATSIVEIFLSFGQREVYVDRAIIT